MKDSKHRISSKFFHKHKIHLLDKNPFKTYLGKVVDFLKNFRKNNVKKIESNMFPSKINQSKDNYLFVPEKTSPTEDKASFIPEKISQSEDKTALTLEKTCQEIDYKKEVARKTFHIFTILILPIAYIFLTKKIMLMVILPLSIFIVATDYLRHKSSFINKIFYIIFGRILREADLKKSGRTGASYTATAALLVFALCPKIIAICAFCILAISDGLAALVGKRISSKEFFEKSVAGSSAFGVSALLILTVCGILTNQEFGFYLFGVFAVFVVTILEARPSFLKVDDNFLIPVAFSTIMVLFGFVWNLSY
ncbi:MAG: dolichol kinase [Myxococcota bacterium]|jgi:dolichol kinase